MMASARMRIVRPVMMIMVIGASILFLLVGVVWLVFVVVWLVLG